jgi:RNA polymerase sigma factor (TIGR02999 family)
MSSVGDSQGGGLSPEGEVTVLLGRAAEGDAAAESRLFELLQVELRRVARVQLANQSADHTLQPTALVNEAWLRLARAGGVRAGDRKQFLAVAARAMRTALIDHARRKQAAKRNGSALRVAIDSAEVENASSALDRTLELCSQRGFDPIDLDEALERIAKDEPRHAKLVELRFFGGLTREEAAEVLGVSRATAARDWELVRHRLIWELGLDEES